MDAILQITNPGIGGSVQDAGRPGWKRFGVPAGGAMDRQALHAANRLVDNLPDTPALELILNGAEMIWLKDTWVGIAGACGIDGVCAWSARKVYAGMRCRVLSSTAGIWTYLAIPGGFSVPHWLGSSSAYPRAELGTVLEKNRRFYPGAQWNERFAQIQGRRLHPAEVRDYASPPTLKLWPAPHTEEFSPASRAALAGKNWRIGNQWDRTGFRLEGPRLEVPPGNLASEPVLPGTIQVPPGGQPIVTMPDGPTVGGYRKLAWLDESDLAWLAQVRPGQDLKFAWGK